MTFSGKTTVVTGASAGIGLHIVKEIAKRQGNLALISRRTHVLNEITRNLLELHSNVKWYTCDVRNSHEVKQAFSEIENDFGTIDYLVNNAGVSTSKPIEILSEEGFDAEVDTSLKGTYLCTLHVFPLMNDGGAIVNVSSDRGRTGSSSSSPGYAAAKAGVINLTKSFAMQLSKHRIRVNCVAPAAVYPTEMSQNWDEARRVKIAASNLVKRLGTSDDVFYAIEFLLSDNAGFITGQTLDVNGGIWMG